jgi:hypothetical protein
MLFAIAILLSAPGSALSPPPLPDTPLTFECTGDGDRRLGQDGPFPDRGGQFDGGVTLKLDGKGAARIRVPDAMIPKIHGGGADGWWSVRLIRANQAEVAGSASFNFFDRAHFILDLGLGIITLDDNLGRFVGRCRSI